jgi:hypothetical protein
LASQETHLADKRFRAAAILPCRTLASHSAEQIEKGVPLPRPASERPAKENRQQRKPKGHFYKSSFPHWGSNQVKVLRPKDKNSFAT